MFDSIRNAMQDSKCLAFYCAVESRFEFVAVEFVAVPQAQNDEKPTRQKSASKRMFVCK